MTYKVWFDIDDLWEIRDMAQRYVKEGKIKSPSSAVQSAKWAVVRMKRYFKNGRNK